MEADQFDIRSTSDGLSKIERAPVSNEYRIDKLGYLGLIKEKFDVGRWKCVYVIELDSGVWEESILRAGPKDGRPWIPSFPMGLEDPKVTKSESWKNLDKDKIRGFLYVGVTQTRNSSKDFNAAIKKRHNLHNEGGEIMYIGKVEPSPVVSIYGNNETSIWDIENCITGIFDSETQQKLESWYGWALAKAGYVVYGPNLHRNLKSPRPGGGKIKQFLDNNPFW